MSSTIPRRAFVTLVRDALASANASRLARPLHAKVKTQPPQRDSSADPAAYRIAEPTRSANAPAPLASWRGGSTIWREGERARGASKLPSFRFPEALSATDTTERSAYASDVASASSRAASLETDASETLRAYAASRRDPVLADALGLEFNQRALRSFHSPMRKHLTLDPLISEYSVDSPEGVALMSLAEALIRVPAGAGAYMPDRLIRDTIGAGHLDFMSLLRKDKSALVNASAVALAAVRRVVGENGGSSPGVAVGERASDVFDAPFLDKNDATRDPKPRFAVDAPLRFAVKRAIGLLSNKFTMGDTIGNALRRARANERAAWAKTGRVVSHSFDVLGEGARTETDAARYLASYVDAASQIASSGVMSPQMSVKLSSLSPRFDELSRRECVDDLARKLASVVPGAASPLCVFVDAEEQRRLELTLSVVEATLRLKRHDPPAALGVVVQAYGRRAMQTLEFLRELAAKHPATELRVRLVKGAYWDAEMKEAQIAGADQYPVWTEKRMTDASYLSCAAYLLENTDALPKPAFATHNARTVADVLAMAGGETRMRGDGGDAEKAVGAAYESFLAAGCEFQRLHGMGESFDYAGLPTRVYSPVGQPDDLLAYLIRRLLENGANSSFLKSLANGREDLMNADALAPLAAPEEARAPKASGLPASPRDVYGGSRLSARGVDFENPGFPAAFAATAAFEPSAEGVVAFAGASDAAFAAFLNDVRASKKACVASGDAMSARVSRRAKTLERAADLIEDDTRAMAKLIMQEAGKTLVDAVDEVRECVDFFRFYARRARETLTTPTTLRTVTGESCALRAQPRGPWLCVGPFNFPFAIVGGLASSAFVAGNPVVIKPHPATPKCAFALADVLRRAGAEDDAVRVVVDAAGEKAGEKEKENAGSALVASGAFAGVSFVGSTKVAADINLRLAATAAERDAPLARLVAETGGLNALVVDASALPEQACDAILRSFAQSAGQRCSSARLLIVDAGVKTELLSMLKGALEALRVSEDVADVSTDVGPLISKTAADAARAHCAALESGGGVLVAKTLGEDDGALFHPRVYDLNPDPNSDPRDGLELVSKEVFAPVLHVVTYDGSREALRGALEAMNEKGFALTGGVMTRCESTKALVTDTLDCGNFYVNRDVVGAVVESQPFGGHGLSGNGAKAGSEHYLEQFVAHKVVCEDTTAAGGNLELMRTTG